MALSGCRPGVAPLDEMGGMKKMSEPVGLCKQKVSSASGWRSYTCGKAAGFGPGGGFCKVHAKNFPVPEGTPAETWFVYSRYSGEIETRQVIGHTDKTVTTLNSRGVPERASRETEIYRWFQSEEEALQCRVVLLAESVLGLKQKLVRAEEALKKAEQAMQECKDVE